MGNYTRLDADVITYALAVPVSFEYINFAKQSQAKKRKFKNFSWIKL